MVEHNIVGIRQTAAVMREHHCPVCREAGDDLDALDNLCTTLYRALKSGKKEARATAMFQYEELHEI